MKPQGVDGDRPPPVPPKRTGYSIAQWLVARTFTCQVLDRRMTSSYFEVATNRIVCVLTTVRLHNEVELSEIKTTLVISSCDFPYSEPGNLFQAITPERSQRHRPTTKSEMSSVSGKSHMLAMLNRLCGTFNKYTCGSWNFKLDVCQHFALKSSQANSVCSSPFFLRLLPLEVHPSSVLEVATSSNLTFKTCVCHVFNS